MKKRIALLVALLAAMLGCLVLGACGGDDEAEDCTHPNPTATVTTNATCGADGVRTYTCPDCGETWTEAIPATGSHVWQGPTCQQQTCKNCTATRAATTEHEWQGEACEGQTCKKCSATSPATAKHDYLPLGDAYEKEPADASVYCHGDLYIDYECSICHDKYTTLVLAAKAHTVSEWEMGELTQKTAGSCTYVGTRTGICTGCEEEVTEKYEVKDYHTYITVITKPATCTTPGEKTAKCSVCGYIDTTKTEKYTDENAHQWNVASKSGNVTNYTCAHNAQHTKTTIEAGAEDKSLSVDNTSFKSADEVVVGGAAIQMDETTKSGLTGENLTLGVDTLSASEIDDIDPSLSDRLAGKDVYDFTLGEDGNPVTNFDGTVTVRIPYILQDGEDVNAIVIWYVNGDTIDNVLATYSNGYVTFQTEHFSYYTVGKYSPEEMCEKYGHNIVTQKRTATCVLSGYDIEVCTRCKDVLKNDATPALGHQMKRVEASCSAPTCTKAGLTVEKCSVCGYQTERVLPATGHQYKATVTDPTCTESGYTTHTCSVCNESYKDKFTPAKGHTWDISVPTCTQGQRCTVCGAEGAKATGHKYGSNGVCTVCGTGCEHAWQKGNVVASTCTSKGYTVYTCSKCGFKENRDETPLKDHTYGDNGKCTVCGAAEPSVAAEYERLLHSLMTEKYTISAEDIAIRILYKIEGEGDDLTDVEVNEFEGALQLTKDGVFALHLTGSVNVTMSTSYSYEEHTEAFEIIVLDSTVYLKMDMDGEERIMYMPADSIMESVGEPMGTVLGVLLDPEQLGAMLGQVSEYGDQVVSVLAKFFQKVFVRTDMNGGYKYTFNNAKVRELNDNLYSKPVSEFVDTYFGKGTFEDLKAQLKDLLTVKTIPQAIDFAVEKAGEFGIDRETLFGALNSLLSSMTQGEGPTIEQIYANEDYAKMTIADMIEGMAEMEKGQFASTLDSAFDMLTKTTPYALLEQFASRGGGHVEEDPGMPMAMAEEGGIAFDGDLTAEFLHSLIGTLFADDTFSFSFITDKNSAVKSFSLGVDLSLCLDEPHGTCNVDAKASINFSVGADVDITLPGQFNFTDEILNPLKSKVQASKDKSFTVGQATFTLSPDGTLSLTKIRRNEYSRGSQYDEEGHLVVLFEVEEYRYEFGDISALMITRIADCGRTVGYEFSGRAFCSSRSYVLQRIYDGKELLSEEELNVGSDGGYSYYTHTSVTVYYNASKQSFFGESQHRFEYDPSQSGSEENTPCEGTWDEVYVCAKCGVKYVEKHHKWHRTHTELSLVDGGKTCLDGVIRTEICDVCGKTVESYIYYPQNSDDHPMEWLTVSFETPHGTATFEYYGCACGERANNFMQSGEDGCYFDVNVWDWEEKYHFSVPQGHDVYVRRCSITGCEAYMVEECWSEKVGCIRTDYTKYTFFDGDNKPLGDPNGYLMHDSWTSHDYTTETIEEVDFDLATYGYSGYRRVTKYHYACGHVADHTETYEYHDDEYGRRIYELSIYNYPSNPERNSYREERYEFDGCTYTRYVRYEQNGEEQAVDSGVEHAGRGRYVYPTCTQFGYYDNVCPVCGMGEIEYNELPRGHQYVSDGNGHFHCTTCGLENEQGTDGVFTLEDMTNESYNWGKLDLDGKYVVGVWDKRDLGEETTYYFELIYLDEEGVAHELRIELSEGDYEIVYRAQPMGYEYGYTYNSYMIAISGEAIETAIQNAMSSGQVESGWTFEGLRVTLLPTGTATQQAVSITLTEMPYNEEYNYAG